MASHRSHKCLWWFCTSVPHSVFPAAFDFHILTSLPLSKVDWLIILPISVQSGSPRFMTATSQYKHMGISTWTIELYLHVSAHWQQVKYQLWSNCFMCWMPASNASGNCATHRSVEPSNHSAMTHPSKSDCHWPYFGSIAYCVARTFPVVQKGSMPGNCLQVTDPLPISNWTLHDFELITPGIDDICLQVTYPLPI